VTAYTCVYVVFGLTTIVFCCPPVYRLFPASSHNAAQLCAKAEVCVHEDLRGNKL